MTSKTNRALLELIREALEQNAHGLITDWEAICAASMYASQALSPADGDIDPSTGLKYDGGTLPGNHSTSEPDPFLDYPDRAEQEMAAAEQLERDRKWAEAEEVGFVDDPAEPTAGYVNQDR